MTDNTKTNKKKIYPIGYRKRNSFLDYRLRHWYEFLDQSSFVNHSFNKDDKDKNSRVA